MPGFTFKEMQHKFTRESINRSDEGLMLEMSAFLPFTVANLCLQFSC